VEPTWYTFTPLYPITREGDLYLSLGGQMYFSTNIWGRMDIFAIRNYWVRRMQTHNFSCNFPQHFALEGQSLPLHPLISIPGVDPEATWSLMGSVHFIYYGMCILITTCNVFRLLFLYLIKYIAEQDSRHYHQPVSNLFLQLILHVCLQLR